MKTSELTGALLNYWVARAEGYQFIDIPPDANGENASRVLAPPDLLESGWTPAPTGKYGHIIPDWSTSWVHGGPIIERERIATEWFYGEWAAHMGPRPMALTVGQYSAAPTPLIAAMRAYVASKFGDEVPNEVTP
jgi:hypothetical protein